MPEPLSERDRIGLAVHLHAIASEKDHVTSLFWALVVDARTIAHRDVESGRELVPPASRPQVTIWPASLLYMVLLDQIGTAATPLTSTLSRKAPGLIRALKEFGRQVWNLSDGDIDTLYALRCCFAHDYSLMNRRPEERYRRYWRLFELSYGPERPLIQNPSQPWDGQIDPLQSERTIVNLYAFENLVEDVIRNVQARAGRGELALANDMTADEFALRYSMRVAVG
jgi:hypothetical protein